MKQLWLEGVMYALTLLIAYTLMLVMMTFNAGLFLAIVLGYTVGYLLFGFAPVEFKARAGELLINKSNQIV